MKTLLVFLFSFIFSISAFSQGLDLEDDGNLEYDTISVEGKVAKRKRLSPSEKLKVYRARLEARNKIVMEKKIEQIRIKSELKLIREVQESFMEQMNAIDEV